MFVGKAKQKKFGKITKAQQKQESDNRHSLFEYQSRHFKKTFMFVFNFENDDFFEMVFHTA